MGLCLPFARTTATVSLATSVFTCWLATVGCSSHDHPPTVRASPSADSGAVDATFDTGVGGPPPADAAGLCGNDIVPVVTDRPSLYFVLDRSGSMGQLASGFAESKYMATRTALRDVLQAIGHRVRYGGAVFPAIQNPDGCEPGEEVYATRDGDPLSYYTAGVLGPVLLGFLQATYLTTDGGTPTAASLVALAPHIEALDGNRFVVLATDGAPNCNPTATCTTADCQLNIEHAVVQNIECTPDSINCCDPSFYPMGPGSCVDGDATESAVQSLATNGIKTFVLGMPGSEAYSSLLDRLAIAGQTARATSPFYYPISDSGSLTDTLRLIGLSVSVSCDVALASAPPDTRLVNVYFDTQLVPYDELNGWAWTSATSLELRGQACTELKSGDVLQLQVVAGCPTEVR